MAVAPGMRIGTAATLSLTAAFLWATYYFFVLGMPDAAPPALLVGPFLAGGLGFAALAAVTRRGAVLLALFRDPMSYLRAGLLVTMQISVLASTYLAGPVDTSLLSLVGDVVLTPLLLVLFYREGAERFRSAVFLVGLLFSSGGAALVIVGGASVEALSGWAWVTSFVVPASVAVYFLFVARTSRSVPMSAVVAHSTLVAAVMGVVLTPLVPGGLRGLLPPSALDWGLIAALGLTSFFVAPYLYFRAIEGTGIFLPAVLMASIPVFTLGLLVAIDRTVPPVLGLIGIPIAIVGAVLAIRGPHPPWTPRYDAAATAK